MTSECHLKPEVKSKCDNAWLFIKKVFEPELAVGGVEVGALVTAVAMHAVRVDHEIELLTGLVHSVKELECVLVVNIVVTCTMSQLQHYRLDTTRQELQDTLRVASGIIAL